MTERGPLRENPFNTIKGWYWEDEGGEHHGPFKHYHQALRAILDYCDPPKPSRLYRFWAWLTDCEFPGP